MLTCLLFSVKFNFKRIESSLSGDEILIYFFSVRLCRNIETIVKLLIKSS